MDAWARAETRKRRLGGGLTKNATSLSATTLYPARHSQESETSVAALRWLGYDEWATASAPVNHIWGLKASVIILWLCLGVWRFGQLSLELFSLLVNSVSGVGVGEGGIPLSAPENEQKQYVTYVFNALLSVQRDKFLLAMTNREREENLTTMTTKLSQNKLQEQKQQQHQHHQQQQRKQQWHMNTRNGQRKLAQPTRNGQRRLTQPRLVSLYFVQGINWSLSYDSSQGHVEPNPTPLVRHFMTTVFIEVFFSSFFSALSF